GGYRVCAASRSIAPSPPSEVAFTRCDVGSPQQVVPLLRQCDAVVHLASASTPGSTAGKPLEEIEANLRPTLALLQSMQDFPALPLLFLSSAGSLYGENANSAFGE